MVRIYGEGVFVIWKNDFVIEGIEKDVGLFYVHLQLS
jgi:hypothetical protein